MRLTITFLVLMVLVASGGVWWVNSRSPSEAELATAGVLTLAEPEVAMAPSSTVDPATSTSIANRIAAIDRLRSGPDERLTPAQRAQQQKQFAAEHARIEYSLKGCFDMGSGCKCLGEHNQLVKVSNDTCQLVANERQVMVQ